jgi:hypothetical protein
VDKNVLRRFCFSLDRCRAVLGGRILFPFALNFFTCFLENFHATQVGVPYLAPRSMIDVHMCMWGELFPKRGQLEWPCTPANREACDFLFEEDNIVLDIVQYSYTEMDWRGFPNIIFTTFEPPNQKGNIIIMF